MTDLRKAAEMALDALELERTDDNGNKVDLVIPAIEALRQALAQPEQEPVAYLCENAVGYKYFRWKKPTSHYKPIALYTAPPSKPWVSLTDEEIDYIWGVTPPDYENFFEFPRAIEAALRKKNDPSPN